MLADAQVGVLLTQERLVERLPEAGVEVVVLDREWEQIGAGPEENPRSGLEAENLAYVIYTSGSTGQPKAVMMPHQGIRNRLLWMQAAYGFGADEVVLQKTSFGFDASIWEFFLPLLSGARLVLARPGGELEAEYLAAVVDRAGVSA